MIPAQIQRCFEMTVGGFRLEAPIEFANLYRQIPQIDQPLYDDQRMQMMLDGKPHAASASD